jgi:hypothetical protein
MQRATVALTFDLLYKSTVLEPIFVPLSRSSARSSENRRSREAPIRHEPARRGGLKGSKSRIATRWQSMAWSWKLMTRIFSLFATT